MRLDLTGQRFGKLIVISPDGQDKHKRYYFSCLCDCGTTKRIASRHLVNGKTTSCGCIKPEIARLNGKKSAHKISGSNSYLYKESITDEERLLRRQTPLNKIWRLEVFEHDNFTCQACKTRGGKLEAHHLNSYSTHKEERYLRKNGITLCKACHKDYHLWNGGQIKPATEESFYIWYIKRKMETYATD